MRTKTNPVKLQASERELIKNLILKAVDLMSDDEIKRIPGLIKKLRG